MTGGGDDRRRMPTRWVETGSYKVNPNWAPVTVVREALLALGQTGFLTGSDLGVRVGLTLGVTLTKALSTPKLFSAVHRL